MKFPLWSLLLFVLVDCTHPTSTPVSKQPNKYGNLTLTNNEGMSTFEFEKIRNSNLAFGKWIGWSSRYGAGMLRFYMSEQIKVIYVPSSLIYAPVHHEILFIEHETHRINFSVWNDHGKITIKDHSNFYFNKKFSNPDFIRNVQEIVSTILK